LSEARRGARDSKTLEFARVRVSEQMERSEMVRERAKDRAPEPQRRGAEWLRLVIRRSGASPAEATDGRSRSPSTSTPAFPPKNSHTNTSIEQCRNSILKDKSGFFNQNSAGIPLRPFLSGAERGPYLILLSRYFGVLCYEQCRDSPSENRLHSSLPFRSRPRRAGDPSATMAYNVWRKRSASASEHLSDARRGARDSYIPIFARIRASE
jgi:hypothetical protein